LDQYTKIAKDFVFQLLSKSAFDRPTAHEGLKHAWFDTLPFNNPEDSEEHALKIIHNFKRSKSLKKLAHLILIEKSIHFKIDNGAFMHDLKHDLKNTIDHHHLIHKG